ncbi:AraC family transcriptional regulator [Pseudomaricurvus alkylphenolicus]|uniref:AraC family transcriptional regulator n=1 Tax=Pseudomaricurvus alkylphenolicus TaxID=1306991 RepID=UPI001423C593|nr:AraC family transcriptional regulator [Pseudomaricurvus alkylphenolicus]NIB38389.1 AraC family transcriptional regulator [Pseudomaricurvus alkylphenolicus]
MEDLPTKYDDVPSAFCNRMLTVAEGLGVDIEPCLDQLGLDREKLANKNGHITNQQQQELIEAIVRKVDKPGFGLLVGQKVSLMDWGILGYAYVSSPNMRRAFEAFSTYQRLNGPMVNVYCMEEDGCGVISAVENYPLGDLHLFAYEEFLAETREAFERFDIVEMKFTEVRLAYPEPAHAQMYRDLFQCPILFEQEGNQIRFPAALLEKPFNMADEAVAELCIRQCAEVLKNMSEEDPVVDAVRRVLLGQPGITPTLASVADFLHISARTLRRRLHDAGTSYKDILSGVRLGLAAEYLRSTRMAPKQIAYLLGYSGVTSFHRAFKNQYELTPADYRAQYS